MFAVSKSLRNKHSQENPWTPTLPLGSEVKFSVATGFLQEVLLLDLALLEVLMCGASLVAGSPHLGCVCGVGVFGICVFGMSTWLLWAPLGCQDRLWQTHSCFIII